MVASVNRDNLIISRKFPFELLTAPHYTLKSRPLEKSARPDQGK
jgi:hypothetical protein